MPKTNQPREGKLMKPQLKDKSTNRHKCNFSLALKN